MGPVLTTASKATDDPNLTLLRTFNVLTVGLKGVGKSSIITRLKYGDNDKPIQRSNGNCPLNNETIEYKKVRFTFCEADGRENSPEFFARHLNSGVHAIAFVVDSTNRHEMDDARFELLYFMCLQTIQARDAVILIWANKQDLPDTISSDLIRDELKLSTYTGRQWNIQLCSAVTGQGLYEGLDWLYTQIVGTEEETPPPKLKSKRESIKRNSRQLENLVNFKV